MKLHDQDIVEGDKVYDLLEGYGRVLRAAGTQIVARFGNNTYIYSKEGKRLGTTPPRFRPTLYWQDPVVMIPVKDEAKWQVMIDMFRNAYQAIRGL